MFKLTLYSFSLLNYIIKNLLRTTDRTLYQVEFISADRRDHEVKYHSQASNISKNKK